MSSRLPSTVALALTAGLLAGGCAGREYVRGADDPSVDREAMSTSLDKVDMERTLQTLLNQLRTSPVMDTWRDKARDKNTKQNVAITPFINETSEHIDSQLDAMLSETETWLINANLVHVISQERQADIIKVVEGTQHPAFDRSHVAEYGKQLGVQYFITGKVGSADERTEDARRVQYFMFMQVIDTSTSEILWQQKAYVTKAVR
jgi:PBP1b-binding outer membrane lipoprotein LpoB